VRSAILGLALMQAASPGGPRPAELGPQPGERLPEFSLPDQTGALRELGSLTGPKGLVLVFFRSADW